VRVQALQQPIEFLSPEIVGLEHAGIDSGETVEMPTESAWHALAEGRRCRTLYRRTSPRSASGLRAANLPQASSVAHPSPTRDLRGFRRSLKPNQDAMLREVMSYVICITNTHYVRWKLRCQITFKFFVTQFFEETSFRRASSANAAATKQPFHRSIGATAPPSLG
jgi:hypothetical protein